MARVYEGERESVRGKLEAIVGRRRLPRSATRCPAFHHTPLIEHARIIIDHTYSHVFIHTILACKQNNDYRATLLTLSTIALTAGEHSTVPSSSSTSERACMYSQQTVVSSCNLYLHYVIYFKQYYYIILNYVRITCQYY